METDTFHPPVSVSYRKGGYGKVDIPEIYMCQYQEKFVVLAPTGIAAVNVGGVTMHSFFKIPFKPILPDDPEFDTRHIKSRMKYSKEFVKFLRALDLIIIDEISMVRADVIDFVDNCCVPMAAICVSRLAESRCSS